MSKKIPTCLSNNPVRIEATEFGTLIQISKNPDWGWITVSQERMLLDDNGFLRPTKVKAFIKGTPECLESLGFRIGEKLPGHILVEERLTPFNFLNPEKDFKIAGKTGVICKFDDMPIYRRCVYTSDLRCTDVLIEHDNGDEIRKAHLLLRDQEALDQIETESFDEAASIELLQEAVSSVEYG